MTNTTACPHGESLTREEGAEHMACTVYGRAVGVRTIDRWIRLGLIGRTKLGGLQWVRVDRDELDRLAAHGQRGWEDVNEK